MYLQLMPTGKYFGDLAVFAEYEHPAHRADAKSFIFGPLAQTEFGEIARINALHTLNLLFTKTVGNNGTDATRFNPAWQSRLLIDPLLQPGCEYYGQINEILNPGDEVGYLFGLTETTPVGRCVGASDIRSHSDA
jgi:hypothetical protein